MRLGAALIATLACALVAPDPSWGASARGAAAASARGAAAASASARSKRSRKPSKKKRKRREVSRVPNRRTATNMPAGWRWPPSKAMLAAGARCTEALDASGVPWARAPREGKIVTPLVVAAAAAAADARPASQRELALGGLVYQSKFRAPPYTMDCHLALALTTHGPALYELGVRKVVFGSIYRFTKVRAFGKTKNVLSRHALGLAMDVVSVEDDAGVVHDVQRDYPAGDELLRAIEDTLNGSGGFRTVLTPRNDPTSHHDHFHIEAAVAYYDAERNLAALGRGTGAVSADGVADAATADGVADAAAAAELPGPGARGQAPAAPVSGSPR